MAFPINKGSPIWLAKQDPNDPAINKNYRRSVRYYRQMYLAWPQWCANHPGFKELRDEFRRRKAAGEDIEIDHVVPICSKIVSGLHVPWNLQIVERLHNNRKSNRWWPDHPFENLELDL